MTFLIARRSTSRVRSGVIGPKAEYQWCPGLGELEHQLDGQNKKLAQFLLGGLIFAVGSSQNSRIRSFAYNILRINETDSITQDRYAAALGGLDFLLSLKFNRER
jgi:hypothetical protein